MTGFRPRSDALSAFLASGPVLLGKRVLCALFLMVCVFFAGSSASWADTVPPEPSASSSPSPTSGGETSPSPSPTESSSPSESPSTEPLAVESDGTAAVVELAPDQMAVLLLGVCIVSLCSSASLVLAFGNRG